MANAATLGGHVTVEDWANVGACAPYTTSCGWDAFLHRRGTTVTRDVFAILEESAERGTRAYGLNAVGLSGGDSRSGASGKFIMHIECCWPRVEHIASESKS